MKTKILLLTIIGLIINSVMGCSSKTNHSETQPTFQGKSANSFSTWVMDNITFPEELKGESAKTIVSFIINESGDLKDICIVKSSGYKSFDEEVIRTLKLSPKWTPGKKDDKPIDVKLSLPVIFSSTNTDNNNANENTNYNLEELDEKPLFNNRHMNTFVNWVAGNVTYPEEARNKKIDGKTIIKFSIDTDGSVKDVEIIEGSGSELLDNEAKKVVSSSPKWTPGKKNGKAVKVTILFPVIFALR